MDAKFYNRMEFPVNFRKIWITGSPAVKLQSGEIVEGPYEMLSQYRFLAPVPFDFHKVESVTQMQNFEFTDHTVPVNQSEPVIISAPMELTSVNEYVQPMPAVGHTPESAEIVVDSSQANATTLPFDPKTVSWFSVKVDELKQAATALKIDISSLNGLPPKKVKWELVRLIKKATNISGN